MASGGPADAGALEGEARFSADAAIVATRLLTRKLQIQDTATPFFLSRNSVSFFFYAVYSPFNFVPTYVIFCKIRK